MKLLWFFTFTGPPENSADFYLRSADPTGLVLNQPILNQPVQYQIGQPNQSTDQFDSVGHQTGKSAKTETDLTNF